MIKLPVLKPFEDLYPNLPMHPLIIRAHLEVGSAVLQYNPIYLDAILGNAVVRLATGGRDLPHTDQAYDIPVPLQKVWESPEGLPLWAGGCFMPVGEWTNFTIYYHKRAHSGKFSRHPSGKKKLMKIVTIMGPNMERRIPTPALECSVLEVRGIGNMNEIAHLLKGVSALGKRRNLGMAAVRKWEIEEADFGLADVFVTSDDRLSRSIPVEAAGVLGLSINEMPSPCGWASPHWKPSLFSNGWRTGTAVQREEEVAYA